MQPLTNPPHAWVLSRRSERRASTQAWQRVRLSPDSNTTVAIVIGAGRSNAGRQVTAGVQISTSPFETPTTPQTARHTTTKTTVKGSSQSQDLRCSIVQPHLTLCRDRWGCCMAGYANRFFALCLRLLRRLPSTQLGHAKVSRHIYAGVTPPAKDLLSYSLYLLLSYHVFVVIPRVSANHLLLRNLVSAVTTISWNHPKIFLML